MLVDACATQKLLINRLQNLQHTCEVTTHEDSEGNVKRYSRACKPTSLCPKSTLLAKPKNCTGHGDSLHCNYCEYGLVDLDYDCAQPSPRGKFLMERSPLINDMISSQRPVLAMKVTRKVCGAMPALEHTTKPTAETLDTSKDVMPLM